MFRYDDRSHLRSLLNQSLYNHQPLDGQSLLTALQLPEGFSTAQGRSALQSLECHLTSSQLNDLRRPANTNLLVHLQQLFKLDTSDHARLQRLGSYDSYMADFKPEYRVLTSDFLALIAGQSLCSTTDKSLSSEDLNTALATWAQIPDQNKQLVLTKWSDALGRAELACQAARSPDNTATVLDKKLSLLLCVNNFLSTGDANQAENFDKRLAAAEKLAFLPDIDLLHIILQHPPSTFDDFISEAQRLNQSTRRVDVSNILKISKILSSGQSLADSLEDAKTFVSMFQILGETAEPLKGFLSRLDFSQRIPAAHYLQQLLRDACRYDLSLKSGNESPKELAAMHLSFSDSLFKGAQMILRDWSHINNTQLPLISQYHLQLMQSHGKTSSENIPQRLAETVLTLASAQKSDADLEQVIHSATQLTGLRREFFEKLLIKPADELESFTQELLRLKPLNIPLRDTFNACYAMPKDELHDFVSAICKFKEADKDFIRNLASQPADERQSFTKACQLLGGCAKITYNMLRQHSHADRVNLAKLIANVINADLIVRPSQQGRDGSMVGVLDFKILAQKINGVYNNFTPEQKEKLFDSAAALVDLTSPYLPHYLAEIIQTLGTKQRPDNDFFGLVDAGRTLQIDGSESLNVLASLNPKSLQDFTRQAVLLNHRPLESSTLKLLVSIFETPFKGIAPPLKMFAEQAAKIDQSDLKSLHRMAKLPIHEWAPFAEFSQQLGRRAPFVGHYVAAVPADQRKSLVRLFNELICKNDLIGRTWQDSPASQYAPRIKSAWQQLKVTEREDVFLLAADVAGRLLSPSASLSEKVYSYEMLTHSKLTIPQKKACIDQAVRLYSDNKFKDYGSQKNKVLNFLLQQKPAEVETLATHARKFACDPLQSLNILSKIKSRELESFVSDAQLLGLTNVHDHKLLLKFKAIPTSERRNLIELTQQVVSRDNSLSVFSILANITPAERQGTVQLANQLLQHSQGLTPAKTIDLLSFLPRSERQQVVNVLLNLPTTALNDQALTAIVQTPRASRERHAADLLTGVDLENVMFSDRMDKTKASFHRLLEKYSVPSQSDSRKILEQAIAVMQQEPAIQSRSLLKRMLSPIKSSNSQAQVHTPPAVMKQAIEALHRPVIAEMDYTGPISSNPHYSRNMPGLGQMAALVWQLADGYTNKDLDSGTIEKTRDNLRASFIRALAECIEDDGHRVCNIGVSQRLLTVLQGYYPELEIDADVGINTDVPKTSFGPFLNELCAEYERDQTTPAIADEPASFYRHALDSAANYYGATTDEFNEFRQQHLDEFFNLSELEMPRV